MVEGTHDGVDRVRGRPNRCCRLLRRDPVILRHIVAVWIFADNRRHSFFSSKPVDGAAYVAGLDCPMRSRIALPGLACGVDEPGRRIASAVNGAHVDSTHMTIEKQSKPHYRDITSASAARNIRTELAVDPADAVTLCGAGRSSEAWPQSDSEGTAFRERGQ
jgi:hypothetical protein